MIKPSREGLIALQLTMMLSINKEEYARPYSAQEFHALEAAMREASLPSLTSLMKIDVSGFMKLLDMSEDEGYRLYTLLRRDTQISRAIWHYLEAGINIVPMDAQQYPRRWARRLGMNAPVHFYQFGEIALTENPCIAILGISGVKTTAEVRESVRWLAAQAARNGYTVITGGEPGVSRIAANAVLESGGTLLEILGGDLLQHIKDEPAATLAEEGRASVLSLEHPEAMLTIPHAIARNRCIFALSDAVFIFNTDGRRGEAEALQTHSCNWIYAYHGAACNQPLIAKGAIPFDDIRQIPFDEMTETWRNAQAEQVTLFDLLNELPAKNGHQNK